MGRREQVGDLEAPLIGSGRLTSFRRSLPLAIMPEYPDIAELWKSSRLAARKLVLAVQQRRCGPVTANCEQCEPIDWRIRFENRCDILPFGKADNILPREFSTNERLAI